MQLTRLDISLCEYGLLKGTYSGKVYFRNADGGVDINLDASVSDTVLKLCAEALTKQAQKTAALIVGNILEHPALEHKGE